MLSVQYNKTFSLGDGEANAVCYLPTPCAELVGGKELPYDEIDELSVNDTYSDEGNGLFKATRTVKNIGDTDVTFRDIFEVRTAFTPARYLIPCVNYNGNDGCRENTPTGLTRDGSPWIFAYDRMGIPSCSLCENK